MAEHIRINDVAPRIQFVADGAGTSFTFPFAIFAAGDLQAFLNGVQQTTGFTVTGAGSTDGGTCSFATAPAAGTFHGIDVADLTLGGDFFPATWFGVGFFLTGVVGIEVAAPSIEARGAVYGLFQAGLRIALEPQRKAVNAASVSPTFGVARAEDSVFSPGLYNPPAR